jgi:hypothetical protein
LGFRVWGSGFKGYVIWVYNYGFRVQGVGFMVWGAGIGFQGVRSQGRVQDLGLRMERLMVAGCRILLGKPNVSPCAVSPLSSPIPGCLSRAHDGRFGVW